MKELSIQIKVYPVSNMRQDVYRFMADEFEFTPVPESSEAGRFFNCNKDISISLPPSGVLNGPSFPAEEVKGPFSMSLYMWEDFH